MSKSVSSASAISRLQEAAFQRHFAVDRILDCGIQLLFNYQVAAWRAAERPYIRQVCQYREWYLFHQLDANCYDDIFSNKVVEL